jgi:hypothetical protein
MRQLGLAAIAGILGMILAAVLVRYIAGGDTSISENWIVAGAVLPVMGVAGGTFLSHRISGGADPWPVVGIARRIPFAILCGVLGALTWYISYLMLVAVWNHQSFIALATNPGALPTLYSAHDSASASSSPMPYYVYIVIGLVAGAWITDSTIKRKWS